MTADGFVDFANRITGEFANAQARDVQRLLFSNVHRVEADGSGRIAIPKRLRLLAGIEDAIVLFGDGEKILIWSFERWIEVADELESRVGLFSDRNGLSALAAVQELLVPIIRCLQSEPEAIYDISPRRFEELVAELLASHGWRVTLTASTRDGGYDIFGLSKDKLGLEYSWLVECKRNAEARNVGLDVVRNLYCLRGHLGVGGALVATTAHFSRDALEYKKSHYNLALRDKAQLVDWINNYHPRPGGKIYLKSEEIVLPG